jgi:hypothetical protein
VIAWTALVCVLASAGPTSSTAAPARVAIVIGYNGAGEAGRPVLSYADDDAARLYLAELPESDRAWLLTTFDADSARLFPDLAAVSRPPTKQELTRVLGEAFWRLRELKEEGRATELVFSFAGHGDVSPAGEGFVVLADGAFMRGDLVVQVVRASPADLNHVLLDACASYFMVAARGARAPSTGAGDEATAAAVPLTPELLSAIAPSPVDDAAAWARTGTLVSTSDSAAVHESGALGAGVFSYLLRSALAGAGDVNGDGRVEYAEAAAFIASASAAITDPRARLRVHAVAPAQRPNVALGDLTRGGDRRFLALDVAADHVRVLDAHGVPYAELRRPSRAPVLIALQGSAHYVIQVGDREATLVPRTAGAYALSSLSFAPAPKRRGAEGAFEALFAHTYDASYVAGFVTTSRLPTPRAGPAFAVPFVEGAAPPFRWPLGQIAVGSFVSAGVLAAASATCAVMNLVRFGELQTAFETSATIDGDLAFEVEAWRTASTVGGALALGASLAGAAAWWGAAQDDGPELSIVPGSGSVDGGGPR